MEEGVVVVAAVEEVVEVEEEGVVSPQPFP